MTAQNRFNGRPMPDFVMSVVGGFLLLLLLSLQAESSPTFEAEIPFYKKFSDGAHFYRMLTVDESSNSLYVGAMNRMYRLWLFNINETSNSETSHVLQFASHVSAPSEQNRANCVYRSRAPQFQCQNHFRVVLRRNDGSLYVCGTNAFQPQVTVLNGLTLEPIETGLNGVAICAHNPDDNATAVWVDSGNPSDIGSIYSATVTDYTQANRIIYRPPLLDAAGNEKHPYMKTVDSDSNWLNEPQFVGSFDVGQYVYFFFRELASEVSSCGRKVFSRVARLCKNDLGGQHVLLKNWSTFVKARITCSLPGEFPFHFDHIQSVVQMKLNGQPHFYATFQTPAGGYSGSAICSFALRDIDSVFDYGGFKEQVPSCPAWLPVSADQAPSPRPGQCTDDSLSKTDDVLHFIKTHLLLDDSIAGSLLFDVRDRGLRQLAVDLIERTDTDTQFVVVFAAADDSSLYKVAEWRGKGDKERQSALLAKYSLPVPAGSSSIHALQLFKMNIAEENDYLYLGMDDFVGQVAVQQCQLYHSCTSCTSDPYCAWNTQRRQCYRMHDSHTYSAGWLVNAAGGHTGCSQLSVGQQQNDAVLQRLVYPADTLHLSCVDGAASRTHGWTLNGRPVATDARRKFTDEMEVIVLNVSSLDAGKWSCVSEGAPVITYHVEVDEVNCQQPRSLQAFQSVYREWCREFHQYKTTMTKWQEWYEQNSQCSSAPNFKKLVNGGKLEMFKDTNMYV